jgi:hypothetical protein
MVVSWYDYKEVCWVGLWSVTVQSVFGLQWCCKYDVVR